MKRSRVRLVVAALLFVAWISWLVYLSATTTRPVVLSRPQFLAANCYVIADLQAKAGDAKVPADKVAIRQVVWSRGLGRDLKGQDLEVKNLNRSDSLPGWQGPGEYILPLTVETMGGGTICRLTPIPRSPGFIPRQPYHIYPATPPARRELRDLIAEFHKGVE